MFHTFKSIRWQTQWPVSQNVRMPRAWLLLLAAVLIAGCAKPEVQLGGDPHYPNPQAIISLSPSATEIMCLEGVSSNLKGRTEACNYPPNVKSLPVFASVKPYYEKIQEAKPDLVVYEKDLYSDADIAKLKEVVGPDHLVGLQSSTIEGFESELRQLGMRINHPLEASQYIDKINREKATAQAAFPATKPKIAIVSGSYISGTKSFLADVVKACGGEPVGPDSDRFVPLNPEALVQSNPDVVVLAVQISAMPAGTTADQAKLRLFMNSKAQAFMADPRIKTVKAIASGRVVPFSEDVLVRKGYRVDSLIRNFAQLVAANAVK